VLPQPQAQLVRPEPTAARASGENFPVALRVLPRAVRTHLFAIYGFARFTDDLGDEGDATPAERLAALDRLDADLDRLFATGPTPAPEEPVVARLAPTVRECSLPEEPFRRLVEANRIDQRVERYETWDELRGYCGYSADPVGRMVLGVFGFATPEREARSDDVCTALQLIEHVQDVGEDHGRGRVYLPAEDLDRFGCTDAELASPPAAPALRRVVQFESDRARVLLRSGLPLVAGLRGSARLAIAGFVAGGLATLDAFAAAGGDVLTAPRRPAGRRVARHLAGVLAAARRYVP
jgi:squalene synthase HpnC